MNRLIALLLVISSISAQARVGETIEQCIARYGPVVEKQPAKLALSDKEACVFSRNGITIVAEYKAGIAWRVAYRMIDFDADTLANLLAANALESGWSKVLKIGVKDVRATTNRERMATFSMGKRLMDASILEVTSAEFGKANRKEYEARLAAVPALVRSRISADPTKPF